MLSQKASHTHLAISPDSRWLAGGEGTGYVIWDSTTWKKAHELPAALADSVPGSTAFSPDGRLLALEVEHAKIRLLRVGTWEEVLTITPPQDLPLVRMAFSPGWPPPLHHRRADSPPLGCGETPGRADGDGDRVVAACGGMTAERSETDSRRLPGGERSESNVECRMTNAQVRMRLCI